MHNQDDNGRRHYLVNTNISLEWYVVEPFRKHFNPVGHIQLIYRLIYISWIMSGNKYDTECEMRSERLFWRGASTWQNKTSTYSDIINKRNNYNEGGNDNFNDKIRLWRIQFLAYPVSLNTKLLHERECITT